MANTNNAQMVDENDDTPEFEVNVPKGMSEQSSDLVGFYREENGPIYFIPREVRLFDNNIDDEKVSGLLIAELVSDCELVDKDDNPIMGKKGEEIGIWLKPGMRALSNLAGEPVYMYQHGELDTGKPNPMPLYKIFSKKRGNKLMATSDYRKVSRKAHPPIPLVIGLQEMDAGAPPF